MEAKKAGSLSNQGLFKRRQKGLRTHYQPADNAFNGDSWKTTKEALAEGSSFARVTVPFCTLGQSLSEKTKLVYANLYVCVRNPNLDSDPSIGLMKFITEKYTSLTMFYYIMNYI